LQPSVRWSLRSCAAGGRVCRAVHCPRLVAATGAPTGAVRGRAAGPASLRCPRDRSGLTIVRVASAADWAEEGPPTSLAGSEHRGARQHRAFVRRSSRDLAPQLAQLVSPTAAHAARRGRPYHQPRRGVPIRRRRAAMHAAIPGQPVRWGGRSHTVPAARATARWRHEYLVRAHPGDGSGQLRHAITHRSDCYLLRELPHYYPSQ